MPSAGEHDYAIVRFAPTGAVLWSERYGGTENEQVIHLGADREGDPVIVSYVGPALFEPDVPSSGPEASRWVITKLPR